MDKVKSVFIVDDDRDDVDLFCEAINEIDKSIACLVAFDSARALEILKNAENHLPDIIFLDLNMPGVNGKQFLVQLKKHKKWGNIPVIIYTTSKNEDDRRETRKLGAAGFITKPSTYREIYRILSQTLNGGGRILK